MAGFRIPDFDTWRPGYAGASVSVLLAGTDTLASIFADQALTVPLANPQTLLTLESSDIQYGKWAQPVYAGQPVELLIGSIDKTGIILKPLTDLVGVDAAEAVLVPTGAVVSSTLADLLARTVDVRDYGVFDGVSAAVNSATLTLAIGAAAGLGGGAVRLPAGTFPFNTLVLPSGVLLVGDGRGVTIIQSTAANEVIEISGNRCGFVRMSVDGVLSAPTSIGVFIENRNEVIFDDAEVLRFETGIKVMGGERASWHDLYIENCNIGVHFRGEGGAVRHNHWVGGLVTNCLEAGVRLEYHDALVIHNQLQDVGFENNPVLALDIAGARFFTALGCWFVGPDETADLLNIADDPTPNDDNTIQNLTFDHCRFDVGEIKVEDTCLNVAFLRSEFGNVDVTLTLPTNAILVTDCIEREGFVLLGEGIKWSRWTSAEHGTSEGLTTDASATKAWAITLEPGEVIFAVGKACGNQVNGTQTAEYYKAVGAKRAGSTLAYDTQVANFTVGQVLTGATSGAEAIITADADGGATGTLTLRHIKGAFVDNETITDPLGGQALANGTLVSANVALLGTVEAVRADREDAAAWDATFVANGPELEFRVTGEAAKTIEWVVTVDITRNG